MKSPAVVFGSSKKLCKHDFNGTGLEAAELDGKCSFDCGSILETTDFMVEVAHLQDIAANVDMDNSPQPSR